MVRFGIIGLGKIAHKFAHDLAMVDGVELRAVGSRSLDKSSAFAKAYNVKHHHDSYEDCMKNEEVDVIYIATPHVFHHSLTIQCLEAGKAVICEKPMGMNSKQVQEMISLAREKNLFLMEGLWTRFIPGVKKALELINKGAIGKVKHVKADFGFYVNPQSEGRLTQKNLGGGSLLDIGLYPMYLCNLLLGKPDQIFAKAEIVNGVDRRVNMIYKYGDASGTLYSSFEHKATVEAIIQGTDGILKMHEPFHHCSRLTLTDNHGEAQEMNVPHQGEGYYHEIEEVRDCIHQGKVQSDKVSWDDSLALHAQLDEVRNQIGLFYE
ncbi:hypothetical protein BST97_14720 [Nonlabens spongiae]|uniref:Oxidoreductase n=2 Tax=Nonlabens spongiae TaxID=331648 RepID=A0A1W6MPJ4_9FLAO|nr:hypothetical protein BST97_14720 [Nonlabens spongiae]